MLNRLNWEQLRAALAVLPTINASTGVDLRAADTFDLTALANNLRVAPNDLENSFCTVSRQDALLDAASPLLRFCTICASLGFHATLFQFTTFGHCPVHGCALCEACPQCGQQLPYRLHAGLAHHPYACPACGHSLLATPSLRRLQQSDVDAAGLDRLHAWHDCFFRHTRLLSVGGRRIRDASGQYLSGDAIRGHADFPSPSGIYRRTTTTPSLSAHSAPS
ncbi:zinc ribbon domain-containing protein [Paraburkholderia terricola]|uniref:RNA-binding Zn-ribbon protein involved in translation (DUF1610 family) n=1 Tax=Paraburkholderia terricola TaxID=169427 RepID=A0ABU1M1Z6_9BURK|nr:zinc ribbon domain-containing protein [Paraburkholderia terricola]MDR6412871.1 putative RNA-binding Zn-ribbon protein involved in translation (DUF1610 family) [Paraburkholderia terricola]MDR6484770.1 putative RNA-binding Zn-ribbon protein involved in translation (DUF1610 family) [Paraburkholderia terricola]